MHTQVEEVPDFDLDELGVLVDEYLFGDDADASDYAVVLGAGVSEDQNVFLLEQVGSSAIVHVEVHGAFYLRLREEVPNWSSSQGFQFLQLRVHFCLVFQ